MVDADLELETTLRRLLGRGAFDGVVKAMDEVGVARVARMDAEELSEWGVEAGVARRAVAAFELGRAVERAGDAEREVVRGAPDVARIVAPELRGMRVEVFLVLLLDARNGVLGVAEAARGTLTAAPVHPREVLGPAVRRGAAAVVVAHNHPSGDPTPSAADRAVTERLVKAGEVLGVPVLDHLVWAEGGWVSLRAAGDWPV
ncbi:MAG: JAB domain-containing protein [Planctomycetota bacterium]|nr:JAB domain-containing protein [Planctomycetota bacterium]